MYNLGGDKESAKKEYDLVLKLNPKNASAKKNEVNYNNYRRKVFMKKIFQSKFFCNSFWSSFYSILQ